MKVTLGPGAWARTVTMRKRISCRMRADERARHLELLQRGAGRETGLPEERLIVENSGLIWSVVRRYTGPGCRAGGSVPAGLHLGFLKAVHGFDPDFGTQFSTYAVPKIAGEMRRFLRDDGAVKVSRTLRERSAAHLPRPRNG